MNKYGFTGETKEIVVGFKKVVLKRIKAEADFGSIKQGMLGGWIEKAENLSQEGNAWVYDDALVCDNAEVCGNAKVYGNAEAFGNAKVYGNAWVCDNAKVCGDAKVSGNAEVCGNAEIYKRFHILVVGPIGSRQEYTTFYRNSDKGISVKCGCFNGNIDEFLKKVTETHGDNKHADVYRKAAELARAQILI